MLLIILQLLAISIALGKPDSEESKMYNLFMVKAEDEHQLHDLNQIIKNAPLLSVFQFSFLEVNKTGYLLIRDSDNYPGLVYHSRQSQPKISIECNDAALQLFNPEDNIYEFEEDNYEVYKVHPRTTHEVERLYQIMLLASYMGVLYSGTPIKNRPVYLLFEASQKDNVFNGFSQLKQSLILEYIGKFNSVNNCSIETTTLGGYGSTLTNTIESNANTSIQIKEDEIEAFRHHLPPSVRKFVFKPSMDPLYDLLEEEEPLEYLDSASPSENESRNDLMIQSLFLTLVKQLRDGEVISEEEKLNKINEILDKGEDTVDVKYMQNNVNMILQMAMQSGYTKIADSLLKRSKDISDDN